MQFSVTLQLNSTFDDLGTLADFSAKLRDLLASFGTSKPAAPAPVTFRHPEPATAPEVAYAATPSAPDSVPAPKKGPGRHRKAEDAPALPLEPVAAAPEKPAEAAPVAEAAEGFSPIVQPASAPATPVAAPVQASAPATGPARTVDDCKKLVLASIGKLGAEGPKRLMKVLSAFGVSAVSNIPADRVGEAYAQLEAAFAA